ncbi:MAG: hypothetical protein A2Z88_02240 [Omnitrophica WOR_2 bacterium GWA2_47_8]|nr:MAG: hypothetical protein A2Z88_02240 [Omnitrophica WOR_2 bacterium GWA2_47_8]
MAMIKWEPWADVERFIDVLPTSVFGKAGLDLAIDVYEEGANVVAKMQLPGIDPGKLNVSVEDDYLRVSGSREEEKEEKSKQYYRKEIKKGEFVRMVTLPAAVEKDKVEAIYERGVLSITMPRKEKKESSGPVKIKVLGA